MKPKTFIGTASWNIPKDSKKKFPLAGTQLQKYSQVLNAVEINSSFYRIHKPETYEKWSASVPENFRFSVKLLRDFTHKQKLKAPYSALKKVLHGIQKLTPKLGPLVVQLPPSLIFNSTTAHAFFAELRSAYAGSVVVEPRNKSWIAQEAKLIFRTYDLGKIIADPEPCPVSDPAEFQYSNVLYYRLHGSPEIYRSNYSKDFIAALSVEIAKNKAKTNWCIFDNTTFGHATFNALDLSRAT